MGGGKRLDRGNAGDNNNIYGRRKAFNDSKRRIIQRWVPPDEYGRGAVLRGVFYDGTLDDFRTGLMPTLHFSLVVDGFPVAWWIEDGHQRHVGAMRGEYFFA